ncbi:MAG: imidazole glycerol phosphate synthase subunit HisH [Aquabacterium sp.]
MIAVVDYGFGNLRSLRNALEYLGAEVEVTHDPAVLEEAERIVLPGVGAFGDAMVALRERGLVQPLTRLALHQKKPVLGICLGMQLFARHSNEHGTHDGLGWLPSHIDALHVPPPLKVPHVGWNNIAFDAGDWLFEGIRGQEANFYFVHSFHMVCDDPSIRTATADYGAPVTAVVRQGHLVATQFHPEKSQDNGLRLLQNWLDHDFAAC